MPGASCVSSGALPRNHWAEEAALAPVASTGILMSAVGHVPSRLWASTKACEREKQLPEGHFRHFPYYALASLQRKKVQIKDKKGSVVLPGPVAHSQLSQCWEDCALFIWLAGLLPHLPHSSFFHGRLSASCLQVSAPTPRQHLSLVPVYHQTP